MPANRTGYASGAYTGQQPEVMQEVVTLSVFAGSSVLFLGEPLRWNHLAAVLCLVAAAAFMFLPAD